MRRWIGMLAVACLCGAAVAAQAEPTAERFDTVVIDAGHGGDDEGARGASGSLEKRLVLSVAKSLAKRLRNAGLRVVDISGDLMGDLYNQGREIAWYLPTDPKGKVPNAPMTWGPQPHKGHIFISDWNSGLWALKLVDDNGRRR